MLTPAEFWNDQPVIPVIVINNADKAVELAQTLVASGIKKIEITLRTPAALEAISRISAQVPEALVGADVFIGVSASNILVESDIAAMAKGSIVFALANPDPEIDPAIARKHASVVATGRSDQPNQINNVLAFPGIFR